MKRASASPALARRRRSRRSCHAAGWAGLGHPWRRGDGRRRRCGRSGFPRGSGGASAPLVFLIDDLQSAGPSDTATRRRTHRGLVQQIRRSCSPHGATRVARGAARVGVAAQNTTRPRSRWSHSRRKSARCSSPICWRPTTWDRSWSARSRPRPRDTHSSPKSSPDQSKKARTFERVWRLDRRSQRPEGSADDVRIARRAGIDQSRCRRSNALIGGERERLDLLSPGAGHCLAPTSMWVRTCSSLMRKQFVRPEAL